MKKARWAVSAVFFVNGFLFANYVARLPDIQDKYHIDYRQLGFVLLASAIGSLLAMPITGGLIARYGSRVVTLTAVFSLCLLVGTFAQLPVYGLLVVAFFFLGASSGITDVAMNAQAVVVEKGLGKSIMASFHGIWSLGMFSGAGTGTLFVSLGSTIAVHLLVMALVSIVAVWYLRSYLVRDKPASQVRGPLFNWPAKVLVGIGLVAFCAMLGEGAMAEWSTSYMRDVMRVDDAWAPLGLVFHSLAMLIGRLLGDGARMSYGDKRLIVACSVTALVGVVAIVLALGPVWSLIGFFLAGLGLSIIVPIAYSRAGNTPGIPPGTGIGMVTTIGYSGFIIGPPIIGLLADWQNLQVAYGFILILFAIMLALGWRLKVD